MSTNHLLLPILLLGCLLAQAGTGILELDSKPGGAEVLVDGKKKGITPETEGKALRIELTEGDHRLVVKKRGFTDKSETIFIGERVTVPHTVILATTQSDAFIASSTTAAPERPWFEITTKFDHNGWPPASGSRKNQGYVDRHGKTIVPALYERVHPVFVSDEEYVCVETECLKRGFLIDRSGKQAFPAPSGTVSERDGGSGMFAFAQEGGLYGFSNAKGETVIPPQYEYARWFSHGLAPVQISGLWGAIDTTGKVIIEPVWKGLYESGGIWHIENSERKHGLLDQSRQMMLPPQFDHIMPFEGNFTEFTLGQKCGVLDRKGNIVLKAEWDRAMPDTNGRVAVKREGKAGLLALNGTFIIPLEWESVLLPRPDSVFGTNLIFVCKKGKWGAIDLQGNVLVPFKWDMLWNTGGGTLSVRLLTKIRGKEEIHEGIIDITGKTIIPIEWSTILSYHSPNSPKEIWYSLSKEPRNPNDVCVKAWADATGHVFWKTESFNTPSGRTRKPIGLATLNQEVIRKSDDKPQVVLKRIVLSPDRTKIFKSLTRHEQELVCQMLFICCPEYFMEPTFSNEAEKVEKLSLCAGFAGSMASLVIDPGGLDKNIRSVNGYVAKLVTDEDIFVEDQLRIFKHYGVKLLHATAKTLEAKKLKKDDFVGKPIYWFASQMREVLDEDEFKAFDSAPDEVAESNRWIARTFLDKLTQPRFSDPTFLEALKSGGLHQLPHLAYEVREQKPAGAVQKSDRSPELQRELDSIKIRLEAAYAAKDYPAQFDLALRVVELLQEPLALETAIRANFNGIDPSIHKIANGLSTTWLDRSKQCPEPGSQSSDLTHLQFFMVKFALATHYHNIQRDLRKAAETLAIAEPHFQIARTSADKNLKEMPLAGMEKDIDDMKAMIRRNGLVEVYNKAVAGIKKVAAMVPSSPTGTGVSNSDASQRTLEAPKSSGEKAPAVRPNGLKPQFTRYAGKTIHFTIQSLGNIGSDLKDGLSAQGGWVTVYDSSQDRKLSFNYDEKLDSKEGHKVSVEFDSDGKPVRFNNLSTGKSAGVRDAY